VGTEAVGNMSEDPGPILELDPEHSVGKDLEKPDLQPDREPGTRTVIVVATPRLVVLVNSSMLARVPGPAETEATDATISA